jgi:hypothetical protein
VERERREDLQELEALRRSLDVLKSHRAAPRFAPRPARSPTGAPPSVDEPEPSS